MSYSNFDNLILPKESRDFLENVENFGGINLFLLQNRFYYRKTACSKEGASQNSSDKNKDYEKYSSLLRKEIYNKTIDSTSIYNNKDVNLMECLNQRNKKIAKNFVCAGFYKLELYDKLIIGESSNIYHDIQPLRLHPLYGIPYLPASVIKGTMRSVWIMERYGGKEKTAKMDDDFTLLFGGELKNGKHTEGKLIFFDLYPEKFCIGSDIQTVHYKDYYRNCNMQPTDDQSPKLISFVCLKDAVFQVFIASSDKEVWTRWQEEVYSMMRCMFSQYGIGAKSTLGYGIGSLIKCNL